MHKIRGQRGCTLGHLLFNFGTPTISLEQPKLQASNLMCRLTTRRCIPQMQN